MANPYREYYLANEENYRLSNTVGTNLEEWKAVDRRLEAALALCQEEENAHEQKTATPQMLNIVISRSLVENLAYEWEPCDEKEGDDPMREMFAACRKVLENESHQINK